MPVMFFSQYWNSEVPLLIALKLCHMIGNWLNFIIPLPKFRGLKKFAAKNMRNLGQFWTTLDFDCEYLWNEATNPKSENVTN